MNTTQWIAVGTVAAVVVSAIAVVAALKGVRDQLRVTVFLTYTERYTKVMNGLPFEARRPEGKYQLSSRPVEEIDRVLSAFREYFNLCSEEMWLREHRRIDQATWSIWERGMRQVALFPSFGEAWEFLACEYEYYGRFQIFVAERLLQHGRSGDVDVARITDPTGTAAPSETLLALGLRWIGGLLPARLSWRNRLSEDDSTITGLPRTGDSARS